MSQTAAAIPAAELRHALGHFTTGVTVVTTTSAEGEPVGTTASAVSALSLDPPLVHFRGAYAALADGVAETDTGDVARGR